MASTVVATDFGGPEVLSVVDEPVAAPGADQVRVEVRAAGTNPIDYKRYSGNYGTDPGALPMHLGFEVAGVVTAVPGGTTGPAGPIGVGDEVIAYRIEGAYASEVLVPASAVLPKPSTLSFEEASGLMLAGTTAIHALTVTGVTDGDTIVVHGASGGVGLLTVQLAVGAGARVIATAGEGRHAYLRELGAEPVTYGPGVADRIRARAAQVDAAIDCVGTDEALDVSVQLVADRGRIVTIAGFGRGPELGIKMIGGGPGADAGVEIRAAARMELVRQVEAGKLRVLVAGTYPLAEAAAAHRELIGGHTHGKIVLIP
jgi:NADPH2:quinone reductase